MNNSTILPILDRELRVAARKRSTFWLRTIAALTSLIIGAGILFVLYLFQRMSGGVPGAAGGTIFAALTWLSFAVAGSAGLFFTSDCLSEEKREGTLGLLFLTDLRGYDVATGKLMAASLRCFYGLLAIFPILAITFMFGGVTGAQFYKTFLALADTLFCSLAAGLFVSALSRDSQKALAAASGLLLLLAAGGFLADSILAKAGRGAGNPLFALTSPLLVFRTAGAWGPNPFWSALAISNGIGWLLLAAACVLVPRTWQDRASSSNIAIEGGSYRWRYGGRRRRTRLRRELMDASPVTWLCCRERWQGLVVWALALLLLLQFAFLSKPFPPYLMMVWHQIGTMVVVLLYLWLASQACRFFLEARRSGLLELLLASPVDAQVIVSGHSRALLRMFAAPICIILLVQGTSGVLAQYQALSLARARTPSAGPAASMGATNASTSSGIQVISSTTVTSNGSSGAISYSYSTSSSGVIMGQGLVMTIASGAVATATTTANLLALVWFGLWMGMTSRSNSLATLKTVALVQVVPLLVIWFLTGIVTASIFASGFAAGGKQTAKWAASIGEWFPFLLASILFVLSLAKDIGFAIWARNKLRFSFREVASHGSGAEASRKPVALPMAVPPRIPSGSR